MFQPRLFRALQGPFSAVFLCALSFLCLGSSAKAATHVVNSTADTIDANDGVTTFREAAAAASTAADADTIDFDATVFATHRTIVGSGYLLDGDITVTGPAAGVTIDANQVDRHFWVQANFVSDVKLSNLTLTNGRVVNSGGGSIYNNKGKLGLTNCTLNNNSAPSGGKSGGAILCFNSGSLFLTNCTLANNSSGFYGGAVCSEDFLKISNCTISGNSAGVEGGGILNANIFSGAIFEIDNTLIALNKAPSSPDISASVTSLGHNLIGKTDGSSEFVATGDQTGTVANPLDPGLERDPDDSTKPHLKNNGSPTLTITLLPASPAVDKGKSSLTTDQRGLPRPVDLPGITNSNDAADIGAFELQDLSQSGADLVVNKTTDTNDGMCGINHCTLREAVEASSAGGGTITFAPAVFGTTRQTIVLSAGEFVPGNIKITGPGVGVVIDANQTSRIFNITDRTLELLNLTLRNGKATGNGGAILNRGTLRATNCTFSGNATTGRGGALYNDDRLFWLKGCTLSGNSADNGGGGIFTDYGRPSLIDCTITANTSPTPKGCGFAGNITPDPQRSGAYAEFKNNILAGNTHADVWINNLNSTGGAPIVISKGYNILDTGNANLIFNQPGDQTGVGRNYVDENGNYHSFVQENLKIGPLQDNGGPMFTHALLPGSLAIDGGNTDATTDSRGQFRPFDVATLANATNGNGSDVGAYELHLPVLVHNGTTPGSNNNITFTEDGGVKALLNAAATLTSDNGSTLTGASVSLNTAPNGNSESLTANTAGTAITASYNAGTRTLSLSGVDTLARYLQVLKTVTYNNLSQDPATTLRIATFLVNDGTATSEPITSSITVIPVNDAPTFTSGANVTVAEDSGAYSQVWAAGISVIEAGQVGNFTISNSNTALFSVQPALSTDGTLTFTPAANAYGSATVTVQLKDDGGTANGGSDTKTVTFSLTVTPVNDAPLATDQQVSTSEDTPLPITLTATDIDSANLTYIIVTPPSHGSLSGTAPNLIYTPTPNFNGTDKFTVKANDGTADSNVVTVTITIGGSNDSPIARDDSYTVDGPTLTVAAPGVITNDSDPDGNVLNAIVVTNPAHGTLNLNTDGAFSYTAVSGFNGIDSFTYRVSDGTASATATVTLTVQGNIPEPTPAPTIPTPTPTTPAPTDSVAPTVAFTAPLNGARVVRFPSIAGVSRDNVGVQKVLLTLRRSSDGKYWNGRIWTTQTTLETNLTGSATQKAFAMKVAAPSGANLLSGVYFLSAVTFDAANNRGQQAISFRILDVTAPIVTITAPRTGTSTAALTEVRGTASDEATGSGTSHVFLFIRRSSDGKYWTGRSWASALATLRTTLSGTGRNLTWARTTQLPIGPASGSDIYYITAAAYDRSGNRSTKTIAMTTSATPTRATEADSGGTISRVALSSSATTVTTQSIALRFAGALDATAVSDGTYAVFVNGQTVLVEGVSYEVASSTVTLLLPDGSVKSGDVIDVSWNGLLDTRGYTLRGQTRVTAR